jgi:hypothetical protein
MFALGAIDVQELDSNSSGAAMPNHGTHLQSA